MSSDPAPDRRRTSRGRSVRDTVLDVALGMYADGTWDRKSMERIASDAGVSRQTLYNTFCNRDGISRALLSRETDRLLNGVERRWSHARRRGAGPSGCLAVAMCWVLAASHDHPLLPAVLTGHGRAAAGPSLLALQEAPADQQAIHDRPAGAIGAVTELCHRLVAAEPDGQRDRLRGVEGVVRLTVSYLLVPTAITLARSQIAYAARSLLPDSRFPAHAPGVGAACRRPQGHTTQA